MLLRYVPHTRMGIYIYIYVCVCFPDFFKFGRFNLKNVLAMKVKYGWTKTYLEPFETTIQHVRWKHHLQIWHFKGFDLSILLKWI